MARQPAAPAAPVEAAAGSADGSREQLRSKLNKLGYHQPLSDISAPLTEHLLGDLLRSAEGCRAVWARVEGREQEAHEWASRLRGLKLEQPRLLQENTELHRRLLGDGSAQDARLAALEARAREARGQLTHLRALQDQESHRGERLQQSVGELRARCTEMRRLRGAGALRGPAAVLEGPWRAPWLAIQRAPAAPDSGSIIDAGDAETDDAEELSRCVRELSVALADKRRRRAALVARLAAAEAQAHAADVEIGRLEGFHMQGPGGGSSGSASPASAGFGEASLGGLAEARAEESRLALQEDFLRRSCQAQREHGWRLESEVQEASAEAHKLAARAEAVKAAAAGARRAHAGSEEAAAAGAAGLRSRLAAARGRQGEAASALAALQRERGALELQLRQARAAAAASADAGRQPRQAPDAGAPPAAAAVDGRQQLLGRLARLEEELPARASVLQQRRLRCSGLAARLAALRRREAEQQDVLAASARRLSDAGAAREAAAVEAAEMEGELQLTEAAVLAARGRSDGLRAALQELREELRLEDGAREAEERAEARLESAAEDRQQARRLLDSKVIRAQADAHSAESAAAAAQRRADRLGIDATRLRLGLAAAEEKLRAVQREHRELSAGVGRTLPQLERVRGELSAEQAVVRDLEALWGDERAKMIRLTHECEQSRLRWSAEERSAAEELAATTAASEELALGGRLAGEELSARLRELEPGLLEETSREIARLAHEENPRLLAELQGRAAAAADSVAGGEARLAQLGAALAAGRAEHARERERLEVAEAALEAEVGQRAAPPPPQGQHGEGGSADEEQDLEQLLERRTRLGAQLQGLELSSERLRPELAAARAALAELRSSARGAEPGGPAGAAPRVEELVAESQGLRRTIESVEADSAALQRAAADGARRLERLRSQAAHVRGQCADAQWALSRLRHAADLQGSELAEEVASAEAAGGEARRAEAEVQALLNEAEQSRRDSALGLEDLLHMTRENQLLHGQLLRVRQQYDELSAAAKEHHARARPRAEELGEREAERTRMLWLYQEALDERQRNQAAIAEASGQAETAEHQAKALQMRLLGVTDGGESTRARLLRESAELVAARARLSDVARALEMQELTEEASGADRARLRHAVSTKTAEISEACMSNEAVAAQTEALRLDVESLQRDFQEAQLVLANGCRERDEAQKAQVRMQELLAQQRRAQLQLDAERGQLRSLLKGSPACAGAPLPVSAAAAGAPLLLRRTLEQQQALLAEMRAEKLELAEDRELLRAELAARPDAAARAAAVPGPLAQVAAARGSVSVAVSASGAS